ncbi:MAG: OmpH family outer membrane protein [Verrucomicrobia bacterium]|nr:OmpH family outer membrane protein [Verrucomicrobiota bacterium]
MNKLLKNLLILIFSVLTINANSIAVVDEQRVLSEYVAFNQAREKVLASVAPIQEEIQKMQEEITNIIAEAREADATSNNPALDDKARDKARSKIIEYQTTLQNKQVQLQQFSQQAQELGQNGQQQELLPLQQKAQDAVKKIAEESDIDIVLSTNSVIYVEDALDISDKIIAELNK